MSILLRFKDNSSKVILFITNVSPKFILSVTTYVKRLSSFLSYALRLASLLLFSCVDTYAKSKLRIGQLFLIKPLAQ